VNNMNRSQLSQILQWLRAFVTQSSVIMDSVRTDAICTHDCNWLEDEHLAIHVLGALSIALAYYSGMRNWYAANEVEKRFTVVKAYVNTYR
jgi:hypothetical protein